MKKATGKSSGDMSYSTAIQVNKTPEEVFSAINNVRGWWSESIEGITDKPNSEFLQYYRDIHIAKMKIVEFVSGCKVTWLVLDSYFSFTSDQREWANTRICFEIVAKGHQTQLLFTHQGLTRDYECYEVCHSAWYELINLSLQHLIITGKGRPNPEKGNGDSPGRDKRWKLSNETG